MECVCKGVRVCVCVCVCVCVFGGIVIVFLLSGALGLLQFYKFEGGKTSKHVRV